jgi:hypothetical protein
MDSIWRVAAAQPQQHLEHVTMHTNYNVHQGMYTFGLVWEISHSWTPAYISEKRSFDILKLTMFEAGSTEAAATAVAAAASGSR